MELYGINVYESMGHVGEIPDKSIKWEDKYGNILFFEKKSDLEKRGYEVTTTWINERVYLAHHTYSVHYMAIFKDRGLLDLELD